MAKWIVSNAMAEILHWTSATGSSYLIPLFMFLVAKSKLYQSFFVTKINGCNMLCNDVIYGGLGLQCARVSLQIRICNKSITGCIQINITLKIDWFGKERRDQKWLSDWNFIRLKSDVNTLLDGSSISDEICHILVVNAYFEWWKKRSRLLSRTSYAIYNWWSW